MLGSHRSDIRAICYPRFGGFDGRNVADQPFGGCATRTDHAFHRSTYSALVVPQLNWKLVDVEPLFSFFFSHTLSLGMSMHWERWQASGPSTVLLNEDQEGMTKQLSTATSSDERKRNT